MASSTGGGLIRLSPREVQSTLESNVSLDATDKAELSIEVLAAYLRRNASVLCPCSISELINSVAARLAPLAADPDSLKQTIGDILALLIGYGDLLEGTDIYTPEGNSTKLLFLQKPSFIWLGQSALLLGIPTEGAILLPQELQRRVKALSHRRQIKQQPSEDLRSSLCSLGLTELDREFWRRKSSEPFGIAAEQYVSKFLSGLRNIGGTPEGLTIIDGRRSPDYYRGRWSEPNRFVSGLCVGRRSQMFGNPLWCCVEMVNGSAARLLDFPYLDKTAPGRNEAWRLQMALDRKSGNPQRVKVDFTNDDTVILHFFSPVPTWQQRRLENAGEPAPPLGLFSYELGLDAAEQELNILETDLWLHIDD